jgi:hypothetical protein
MGREPGIHNPSAAEYGFRVRSPKRVEDALMSRVPE